MTNVTDLRNSENLDQEKRTPKVKILKFMTGLKERIHTEDSVDSRLEF